MKETVTCIFENSKWEILLMLRDNKPDIPFPNMWYLPGGRIESSDSSTLHAITREVKEEFQIKLGQVVEWKKYDWPDKQETVFVEKGSLLLPSEIDLQEWQEIRFFTPRKILKWWLAFHDDEIMRDYFNSKLCATFSFWVK